MEWRFAEDKLERLPELAAELVQLKVDVIVTHATPAVRAAMQATKTIPVVMTSTSDPVGSGFTSSMARPDRNVTGLTIVAADLAPKHLDFLKILVPNMTKVAVLVNPGNTSHAAALKGVQAAAQSRGIQTLVLDAAGADELRRAFDAMHRAGVKAAIMPADSSFVAHRRLIAELGIKRKIVVMQYSRENVVSGGLISYGTNVADSYRRAATYVDKILKGAKPADLPIEQPSSYHLVFNLKSAKAMGLRVPQEILGRADEIIE